MSKAESTPSDLPFSSVPAQRRGTLRLRGTINVVLALLVAGCGSDDGTPGPGAGSGGAPGAGGLPSFGGSPVQAGSPSVPTGGAVGAAGSLNSGGAPAAGGSSGAPTAGAAPTGGVAGAGGTSGKAGSVGTDGGKAGAGGMTTGGSGTGGSGGAAAGGPSGGAATGGSGGGGSGMCQKGTTKGNEVLFIGESFVAASSIPEETTKLARAAGSLGASESYVDKSVSGTWIGNGAGNSIPNQYRNNSNGVRFVLMNGGGNDCWQGGKDSDRTNALNAAKTLFQDMGKNGVEKIVYFFYPDPIGANFASLTACLNLLRPDMKALCDAQTAPKCYWVDLRETWNGHPEYTSDGIHVAGPGNAPTAGAIFKSMQANCVAP